MHLVFVELGSLLVQVVFVSDIQVFVKPCLR